MTQPYRVAPSPIHGEGVFATRPIKEGEILLSPLGYGMLNFRGFNHSCSPNLGRSIQDITQSMRPVLRDIAEGEEITVPYMTPSPGKIYHYSEQIPCNCPVCCTVRQKDEK